MATKPKILNQPLHKRIAQKRKAAGKTQQQIADALGKHVMQISRWERGERNPSVRSIVKLSEVFGCPVTDLI